MTDFKDFYIAHNFSGFDTLIREYYDVNTTTDNPKIVNIQLRYWIEAVEKFEHFDAKEYDEKSIEEAILIINLLGNSLLVLGGMNIKTGRFKGKHKNESPDFHKLYSGAAWDMNKTKEGKPLYRQLVNEFIPDYNKISKHFNWNRKEMILKISYKKISEYMELTRKIWLWVIVAIYGSSDDLPDKLDYFFMRPYT